MSSLHSRVSRSPIEFRPEINKVSAEIDRRKIELDDLLEAKDYESGDVSSKLSQEINKKKDRWERLYELKDKKKMKTQIYQE